jgi:hypothetical protein
MLGVLSLTSCQYLPFGLGGTVSRQGVPAAPPALPVPLNAGAKPPARAKAGAKPGPKARAKAAKAGKLAKGAQKPSGGKGAKGSVGAASSTGASSAPPSGRRPPSIVEQRFAQRFLAEQFASRVNLSKLAAGAVKSIVIQSQGRVGSSWRATVSVSYTDGTSAPGTLVYSRYGGAWYFTSITGGRTVVTGGEADTIAKGGPPSTYVPNQPALVSIFIQQQRANQEYARAAVAGAYTAITIDSVDRGLSTATLLCTLKKAAGGTQPARIGMLRKAKVWYLVRVSI